MIQYFYVIERVMLTKALFTNVYDIHSFHHTVDIAV